MSASEDEQLLGLVSTLRARMGDAVLTDPGRLSAMLGSEAPELRGSIRGLVTALANGAPARIAAAADPAAEAQSCAAQVAAQTGLDPARCLRAVQLAARVGAPPAAPGAAPASAAPRPAAPAMSEWVGATVPVAPAALATPVPAQASLAGTWAKLKSRPLLLGLGVVAVVLGLRQIGGGLTPDAAPAPAVGAMPVLAPDPGGQLPTIQPQAANGGVALDFAVPSPGGQLLGRILVADNWNSGKVMFGRPNSQQPETVSAPGALELVQQGNLTARLLHPQWQRDGVSAGPICVMFLSTHAEDVRLHGSRLCVTEASQRNCTKPIGCGTVG